MYLFLLGSKKNKQNLKGSPRIPDTRDLLSWSEDWLELAEGTICRSSEDGATQHNDLQTGSEVCICRLSLWIPVDKEKGLLLGTPAVSLQSPARYSQLTAKEKKKSKRQNSGTVGIWDNQLFTRNKWPQDTQKLCIHWLKRGLLDDLRGWRWSYAEKDLALVPL